MSPLLRPMLADVTEALGWCRNCDGNGWITTTTGDGSFGTLEKETCPKCDGNGCEVYEPKAALEMLHTRGLWPWDVEGERAARWWCPTCAGRGCVGGVWVGESYVDADVCDVCSVEDPNTTGGYAVRGWLAEPLLSTHLAAVASLGAGALLRATSLADVLAPRAMLAWRVMPRAALAQATGTMMTARIPSGIDHRAAQATFWSLRENRTHLLSCNPSRVVLGVEALS